MRVFNILDYGAVPGSPDLQTKAIQQAFDACRENGGTVVIPCGSFRTGGLRMWSDTTLHLDPGAHLIASETCEDYPVFDVPEDVELHTDMELITQYYQNRPWPEYRRALLSVYGGENISVIGAADSVIDGQDCCDPNGEEGYRGPHGFFFTNVKNVRLEGYTIRRCGNFMHQIDTCENITLRSVTCIGGSDGVHLHHCRHIRIEDCIFHTGDDCIAGINMEDMTVRNCEINTSCQAFRCGGSHILIENCRIWGPGIYPHRMTIIPARGTEAVRNRKYDLPQTSGRHNLICVYLHFASTNFIASQPYHDVVFRNCSIENADSFLLYHANEGTLMSGTHLTELKLENISMTGLKEPSSVWADPVEPLTITLQNVRYSFREGVKDSSLIGSDSVHTTVLS